MGVIFGLLGVTACVLFGFMISGGPIAVLFQPLAFIVILGTAFFTLVTGNPGPLLRRLLPSIVRAIRGSGITRSSYYDLLGLMASIFETVRREGVLGIESDLADPMHSARFAKFPSAARDRQLMETLTTGLKLFIDGVVNAFDLERLLDTELETQQEDAMLLPQQVMRLAETLPALGIVAAVLGIIITMQSLDSTPHQIGFHVATAMVGTMLGVLLSYGYCAPIANKMEHIIRERSTYLKTVKAGLVSFASGAPPQVALEFARKTIPPAFRPTAEELETLLRQSKR